MGVNFFVWKNDQTGGGSEGGLAKDHTFSGFFFLNPSLTVFNAFVFIFVSHFFDGPVIVIVV